MLCVDCLDEVKEEPPGCFTCSCGCAFVVEGAGYLGALQLVSLVVPDAPQARP